MPPLTSSRTWRAALLTAASLAVTTACVKPNVPARPLQPQCVLASVARERTPPPPTERFTLDDATALLRRHNPEVRRARAQWRAAQAVACVRTPYSNPTLDVGPLFLGGGDILSSPTWGIEAGIGWLVPITDTPRLTDDVNAVRAQSAFAEAASTEREQYLGLRGEYTAVHLWREVVAAQTELVVSADQSLATAEEAVEAGSATALDVQLLKLEAAEIRAERLQGEEAATETRGALGARLGVNALGDDAPFPSDLPSLPNQVPDLDALRQTVARHHPRLTALHAEYIVTEKELRLEVAKRYPPLGIGFTYEYEDVNKFGLPLGIEVPVFDRNQPGVAAAMARREQVRENYAAEMNAIFAEVERARARLEVRRRRLALQASQLAPAKETQEIAEDVLQQTGTFDMLRYLEVLRATRRARVSWLTTRVEVYEAWSDLEKAAGAPLLTFPHHADSKGAR